MQDQEPALIVLLRAIQNEIATQRFYDDAAFYCIDPWAKEVFATLAREREDHAQLLWREYESLRANGRWNDGGTTRPADAALGITRLTFQDGEELDELFPHQWTVDQAIDRRSDDLAALAFGIRMEKRAIEHYRQAWQLT